MLNNWETVELGSVCEVVRGGSPRPIIDYITEEEDGVNWLKIGDVRETDKYFTHAAERIKPSGIPKTREVKSGDLILSNSMSFGRAFITLIDGYIHDGWLRLRCDEDRLDKEYLYYFLTSNLAQNQFYAIATGSVVNNLKSDTVKAVRINLPPILEQKRIASVLSIIDNKIKCNEKINENLQAQAQAIFRDMFPGILSSNGKTTLEQLIVFSNGKKRPQVSGYIPVYGGNGILAYTSDANAENCVIIGRVGAYCGNTFLCTGKCWVSDNAIQAKSKNSKSQLFIFYLLSNASLPSRHIGTGQPLMTQGILNAIPILLPEQNQIDLFNEIVDPIQKMIDKNNVENNHLANIRDTLLPKLMNGEIDVSDLDL